MSEEFEKQIAEFEAAGSEAVVIEYSVFKSRQSSLAYDADVVMAVLAMCRLLVNWFVCRSAKVAAYLEDQQDFLKSAIDAEEKLGNEDPKVIQKQKKALGIMSSLSAFIETKILKNRAHTPSGERSTRC